MKGIITILIALIISGNFNYTFPQFTFWEKINSPSSETLDCAIRAPDGRIFAGIQREAIYISNNNGIDWQYFKNPLTGSNVYKDLLLGSDNNLYVAVLRSIAVYDQNGYNVYYKDLNTFTRNLSLNSLLHLYAATADSGIIRTKDYGVTWEMNIIFPDSNINFTSVAIDQSDNIFIGSYSGVYLSTDNGNNWNNIGLNNEQIREVTVTSNGYIFAQSSYRIYRLTNIGEEWELVNNGIPNGVSLMKIEEDINGNLIIAEEGSNNNGVIFLSTDSGDNWETIFETNLYSSSILPFNNKILIGTISLHSTPSSGSYIADITDSTITSITINEYDRIDIFLRNNSGDFYAYSRNLPGILISTDNGNLWRRYETSTHYNMCYFNNYDLHLAGEYGVAGMIVNRTAYMNWTLGSSNYDNPVSSMIYDVESNLVFISTFAYDYPPIVWGGIFKGELSTSTTVFSEATYLLPEDRSVNSLGINSIGWIFAGLNKGVYRSTDKGDSWLSKNNGLTDLYIKFIVIDSKDNIFAASKYSDFFYKSTDNGESWQNTFTLGTTIRDMIIDREDNIYIARSNKVYRSTDSGETFLIFGETISEIGWLQGMSIDQLGYLYLFGNSGIYSSVEPVTSVENHIEDTPAKFNLSHNYPNPFNPSTTIKYEIPELSFVTIKVYDVLGSEVAALVNEEKPLGTHSIEFDATNLPSGVYFYQLQVGNFIDTKKMVLMK